MVGNDSRTSDRPPKKVIYSTDVAAMLATRRGLPFVGHADGHEALATGGRCGIEERTHRGELVLARAEGDERDALLLGEAPPRPAAGLADRGEQRRRGDGAAAVVAQQGDHTASAREGRRARCGHLAAAPL